jgi:hypothetical protein
MKKFIITEEEKKQIRKLYETIGDKLSAEELVSKKGDFTKRVASVLNKHYGINLSASATGSWTDKDYNDTLKKFMEEKGIAVWVCKKGDGWCHDDDEGEVTTKDEKFWEVLKSIENPQATTTTEKINTTHDKDYDYKFENNKYFFKGKQGRSSATKYPNWVEATGKGLESIKNKVKF